MSARWLAWPSDGAKSQPGTLGRHPRSPLTASYTVRGTSPLRPESFSCRQPFDRTVFAACRDSHPISLLWAERYVRVGNERQHFQCASWSGQLSRPLHNNIFRVIRRNLEISLYQGDL